MGLKGLLYGTDDANIFFVYAKNLSQGHGFVYNIGAEKVEGFTSLLWVLIASVAFSISSNPECFLLIVNVCLLSFVLTVLTVYLDEEVKAVNKPYSISYASLAFLSITITSPRYIAWTTFTLMDVGIWSALLVVLTVLLLRIRSVQQAIPLSVFVFLLLLTRPEAILWSPIFIILGGMKVLILHNRKEAFRFVRIPLITYCATVTSLTIFRLYYFGYPLPNTYYAKVSPNVFYNIVQGVSYFINYALLSNAWASLAILCSGTLAVFIGLDLWNTYRSASMSSLSIKTLNSCIIILVTWSGLFIPVINGGDHFGSSRFYQVIHPILVLNIICLIMYLVEQSDHERSSRYFSSFSHRSARLLLLWSIVLLFPLMSQNVLWLHLKDSSDILIDFEIAAEGRKLGKVMTELFAELPEYPRVGVVNAGGEKVAYKGPMFDLLGLNNTAMGHSQGDRKGIKNHAAFDKNVFFAFPPEIVAPTIDSLEQHPFQYDSMKLSQSWNNQKFLKGLYDDSRFKQIYQFVRISIDSSNTHQAITGFCHQNFLSYILRNRYYRVEFAERAPLPYQR